MIAYIDIEKRRERGRIAEKKYYHADRARSLAQQKKWREASKVRVINHYTNGLMACSCCGETTLVFLTIDHMNNDGCAERKKLNGGGHHNYRYIIKMNFPDGYRVMCYNCNCGRARTEDKICPHEKNRS